MNLSLCSGYGRYHTNNQKSPKYKPFDVISYIKICELAMNPTRVTKQIAQWFIPSTLLSRTKSEQLKSGLLYCLVADIDHNAPTIESLYSMLLLAYRGVDFLIYTSRSATKKNPKFHIIIPTIELTGYRWTLAQIVLNDWLAHNGVTPDRKTEDCNQIIYLPNRGDYYTYKHQTGEVFNPLVTWRNEMIAVHERLESEKKPRTPKAKRPPPQNNKTRSLISEFNATFTVEELLLKSGYAQKGAFFRHPNSETGNYSASIKDGKVFTLSSADPLFSTFAHDAFNVFVILMNDGDRKTAMRNAGDNWLSVNGVSWNKHARREYMERK